MVIRSKLLNFKNYWWQIIFCHQVAWVALLLILIHQSIVASSIFLLTEAINRFQAGVEFSTYAYLYLFSMIVPYIPGSISYVFLQKWINKAHLHFVNSFIKKINGCIDKYRETALKEKINSVLARSSFATIKDYILFIHSLASVLLNSILSIVVIGILLQPHLLIGYILSLVICITVIISLHKYVTAVATKLEKQHISYSNILDKSWDNTTLGNQYNYDLWDRQKTLIGKTFYAVSNKLEFIRQAGNLLLAMCSLLPTVFLIIVIIQTKQIDAFMIAALMVSLTRIFLILNSLSMLVHQALDFISMTARLKVLFRVGEEILSKTNRTKAVIGNIKMNQKPVRNISSMKQIIAHSNYGRFTITGANGSGKSTALLALHKIYQRNGFLLPTRYTDLIWKSDIASLSTGQQLIALITEITSIKKIKYIFLDEWDANLDVINKKDIDKMLEKISKDKVVIEVRH